MRRTAGLVVLTFVVGTSACAGVLGIESFHDDPASTSSVEDGGSTDGSSSGSPSEDAGPRRSPDDQDDASTGVDAAAPSACPGFQCEGFESGTLGAWQPIPGATTGPQVSPGAARKGTFGVQASVPAGQSSAYLRLAHAPTGSTYVARGYFELGNAIEDGTAFLAVSSSATQDSVLVRYHPSKGELSVRRRFGNGAVEDDPVKGALARTGWVCLEWIVRFGAEGGYTLRADGVDLLDRQRDVSFTGAVTSAGIVETSVGAGAQAIRFDELVLGSSPVGCP